LSVGSAVSEARDVREFVYRGRGDVGALLLPGPEVHGHDPIIGEFVIYRYPVHLVNGGRAERVGASEHRLQRYEVHDSRGIAAVLWCRIGEKPDHAQLDGMAGEIGATLPVSLVGPTP